MNNQNLKGKYPIKIFYENILASIENDYAIKKDQHLVNIANGLVSRPITLICDKPIATPHADLATRRIVFNESYFAFLWTAIYFLFTAYEKYYIAQSNAKYEGKLASSITVSDELEDAYRLFLWGLSLKDNTSDWPEEIVKLDKNNSWHHKITHIWIRSIVFIFYHEYAHLTLKHSIPTSIEIEQEADNFAIELFYSENTDDESVKIPDLIGAVSAFTTNLFLVNGMGCIRQKNHLDLDVRIDNLRRKIKFKDPGRNYYFETFPPFAVSVFFRIIGGIDINYEKESKSATEFWDKCLKQFDEIKKRQDRTPK